MRQTLIHLKTNLINTCTSRNLHSINKQRALEPEVEVK